MARAVGIGGIFIKAKDPKALNAWYVTHLGLPLADHGSIVFEGPESMGQTVFNHFPSDTDYFGDGPQQSMINFRVDDMEALLAQLKEAGVRIDPIPDDHTYGYFAWIWDPDGNRIELWQPL
jgi:catechol 2,3-dioxygenase-like lactoylglutathione lyase family enzyme